MKLNLISSNGRTASVDIDECLTVSELKKLCRIELQMPKDTYKLYCNGINLNQDRMFLKKYGVKDGDILLVISDIDENNEILKAAEVWANLAKDGANLSILDNMDENHLRFLLLSNVELMSQLRKTCAELFDAIIRRRVSVDNLKMLIRQFIKDENESSETSERSSEIRRFNEEQQRKMDENLRRKNIKRNLKNAIENIPDTFTSHSMLFLNCQLNDHPVFGFVDTGAQATLLSEDCARRVDLFKLVDPNWGGKAKGIGVQKFIGRIHMAILKIGESELPISLCVLPYQAMDILIGLDVLKMYRCTIDLAKGSLHIGQTNTTTYFLPEDQLPYRLRSTQTRCLQCLRSLRKGKCICGTSR